MSGSQSRQRAIEAIATFRAPIEDFSEPLGDLFGRNVFTRAVMQARLPKPVYKSLLATIDKAAPLDPAFADIVASAMKDWAIEKGASHYAHVFYPLTGLTAEKHDSFQEPDGAGASFAEFSGKTLVQGEPEIKGRAPGKGIGRHETAGEVHADDPENTPATERIDVDVAACRGGQSGLGRWGRDAHGVRKPSKRRLRKT